MVESCSFHDNQRKIEKAVEERVTAQHNKTHWEKKFDDEDAKVKALTDAVKMTQEEYEVRTENRDASRY